MASVSATCLRFGCSVNQSFKTSQMSGGNAGLKLVSVGWARTAGFPSLRTSRFCVSCVIGDYDIFIDLTCFNPQAKPETVEKVISIVRKQLALPADTKVNAQSTFNTDLGADSLDTVEIVMALEEEFGIAVEEENSETIVTVQDAADLIEKLVEKKAA